MANVTVIGAQWGGMRGARAKIINIVDWAGQPRRCGGKHTTLRLVFLRFQGRATMLALRC